MTKTTSQPTPHNDTIWIAKGIGIILVVIGHCSIPGDQPAAWDELRKIIYAFHMPLFFLLSGFLYNSPKDSLSFDNYFSFIKKKSQRLLVPYCSITLLLLSIKYFAGFFVTLSHPITSDFYFYILFNPMGGFATLMWFLYTLMIIFVLTPVLHFLLRKTWLLLAVSVLFYFLPFPKLFCLNHVFHQLPFFVLGILLSENQQVTKKLDSAPTFIFSSLLFSFLYIFKASIPWPQLHVLTLGLIGAFATLSLSQLVSNRTKSTGNLGQILITIGIYSSGVYLLHTLAMGPVRIAIIKIVPPQTPLLFFFIAFVVVVAGVVAPILIQKYILQPNALLRRMILGMR